MAHRCQLTTQVMALYNALVSHATDSVGVTWTTGFAQLRTQRKTRIAGSATVGCDPLRLTSREEYNIPLVGGGGSHIPCIWVNIDQERVSLFE